MESISLRGRVLADGTLELRVPTRLSGTDVDVMIVLQPVQPEEPTAQFKDSSWPEGYLDRTFGSLHDDPITYLPPPDLEPRAVLR